MKQYKCFKLVHAEPEIKNGEDGYKVVYEDGYISWSPKDVFEAGYKEIGTMKTLNTSEINGARKVIKDIEIVGNGDTFKLLCKASSKSEGWMKSTKAMQLHNGCLVQVTTQQGEMVAEAVQFVPNVKIVNDVNAGRKLIKC